MFLLSSNLFCLRERKLTLKELILDWIKKRGRSEKYKDKRIFKNFSIREKTITWISDYNFAGPSSN
jgi:hypothetical protein